MSLKDFMNKLQEQDDSDVVYSKPPEDTIHVIPPNQSVQSIEIAKPVIKVIPPDNQTPAPTVLKFKLNSKLSVPPKQESVQQPVQQTSTPVQEGPPRQEPLTKPKLQTPPPATKPVQQPVAQPVPKKLSKEESEAQQVEELFRASGTAATKRAAWYEYYEKAKASRKKNSVVDAVKEGRFAITMDNKVLILPKYEFRSKTTNDILKDKWIKNYE